MPDPGIGASELDQRRRKILPTARLHVSELCLVDRLERGNGGCLGTEYPRVSIRRDRDREQDRDDRHHDQQLDQRETANTSHDLSLPSYCDCKRAVLSAVLVNVLAGRATCICARRHETCRASMRCEHEHARDELRACELARKSEPLIGARPHRRTDPFPLGWRSRRPA